MPTWALAYLTATEQFYSSPIMWRLVRLILGDSGHRPRYDAAASNTHPTPGGQAEESAVMGNQPEEPPQMEHESTPAMEHESDPDTLLQS